LAEDATDARAWNHSGYMCIDRGIYLKESLQRVQRALDLDPDNPAYLDSYGWGLYRMKDFRKAVKSLTRASELAPKELLILKHLGQAQREAGRREDAERTFRDALALAPEDQELHVWLQELGVQPKR
jgi:Flp pilus assembly protein TadD